MIYGLQPLTDDVSTPALTVPAVDKNAHSLYAPTRAQAGRHLAQRLANGHDTECHTRHIPVCAPQYDAGSRHVQYPAAKR